MRGVVALLTVGLVAATVTTTAAATVRRVSFTSVVAPTGYVTLKVQVSPKARCKISVVYDEIQISSEEMLGPKAGTTITWRWRVGSMTPSGRWPVTVYCGKSGKLAVRLRVRPAPAPGG